LISLKELPPGLRLARFCRYARSYKIGPDALHLVEARPKSGGAGILSVPVWATPPDNPVEQRRASLQQRGAEALDRERTRSKAHLCEAGPDPIVADCWVREGKATDADYTAYVRAIGALLRLPAPGVGSLPDDGPPKPLKFDAAEAAWLTYRQQTCDAMTIQWEGGTLYRVAYPKCLVTVTWDHMNELADLYAGLW
jgi:uncharacterized protein YecT (DUF1311 family)